MRSEVEYLPSNVSLTRSGVINMLPAAPVASTMLDMISRVSGTWCTLSICRLQSGVAPVARTMLSIVSKACVHTSMCPPQSGGTPAARPVLNVILNEWVLFWGCWCVLCQVRNADCDMSETCLL